MIYIVETTKTKINTIVTNDEYEALEKAVELSGSLLYSTLRDTSPSIVYLRFIGNDIYHMASYVSDDIPEELQEYIASTGHNIINISFSTEHEYSIGGYYTLISSPGNTSFISSLKVNP